LGFVLETLRGGSVLPPPTPLAMLSTHDYSNNNENDATTTVDPVHGVTTMTMTPTAAEVDSQAVQDELEAFLSSTARMGRKDGQNIDDDDDKDEDDNDQAYESDGGTKYVKEPLSGRWIHEALAPPSSRRNHADPAPTQLSTTQSSTTSTTAAAAAVNNNNNTKTKNKKNTKKDPFHKRNARNWIYVTGLAPTAQLSEIQKFFGRVGLLDLDPETLQPKIKLYRNDDGTLKGDASICYARPESVELALQVLDESPWDQDNVLKVERASFHAKKESVGTTGGMDDEVNDKRNVISDQKRKKKTISLAQRKVARLALLQAQDEGFGERLAGGRKGLRIVVVQSMLDGIPETEWESKIQEYCQEWDVEKITCISKTKVVIVKFVEPPAASKAVETWNGMVNPVTKQPLKALYWDGVTDYTQSHEEDPNTRHEEEKRHDEFGKWLDDQEEEGLPPELRLQVADD
jgi:HIV Tat-specific factor 1